MRQSQLEIGAQPIVGLLRHGFGAQGVDIPPLIAEELGALTDDAGAVADARRRGYRLQAWTVNDPVRMARAMKAAVEAGRHAYLAGRMPRNYAADASSPLTGMIR